MLNFEHQLLSTEAHGTSLVDNVPAKKIDRCRRVPVLLRLIDELASEQKASLRATLATRQQHASATRKRLGSKQHDM